MIQQQYPWIGGIVVLLVMFFLFGWPMVLSWLGYSEECRKQRHKEALELEQAKQRNAS